MARVPFTIDNRFLSEAREKALRYAQKHYSDWATVAECEDLVQDAMMTMYKRIQEGSLTELTSSLSTLVIGFVIKIAKKRRSKQSSTGTMLSMPHIEDDSIDPVVIARAQEAVRKWHDAENEEDQTQLVEVVRQLVENMLEPCKTILWSYYWDCKSMKEIAEENNYSDSDVAKTQKYKCMTKVKAAMENIYKK